MASIERRYTDNEQGLLTILRRGRGRRLDSSEIARIHYSDRKPPKFARRSVVTVLNSLVRKTRGEKFSVKKTARSGPHPISFWIDLNQSARRLT